MIIIIIIMCHKFLIQYDYNTTVSTDLDQILQQKALQSVHAVLALQ